MTDEKDNPAYDNEPETGFFLAEDSLAFIPTGAAVPYTDKNGLEPALLSPDEAGSLLPDDAIPDQQPPSIHKAAYQGPVIEGEVNRAKGPDVPSR